MIIALSLLAGVAGTGLGGIIAAVLGKKSEALSCLFLSFAGGVMTAIVCFGLVPEAMDIAAIWYTITGLIAGVLIIMALNAALDHTMVSPHHAEGQLKKAAFRRSGFIMLFAIGIHNIPEGIAMGAGGAHQLELGIIITIMIALHNIPEGMAIAAPLISSGMRRLLVIFLTALSGLPTTLGAIIGHFAGTISDNIVAFSLAGAGGAMLYVVFGEVIPQAIMMRKDKTPTIILLLGILAGFIIAYA